MKELKIDFDLYVKEKQEAFNKGVANGVEYSFKTIMYYLTKKERLKDFLIRINSSIDEINFHWEPLMKALGRNDEWEELKSYLEEIKRKEEETKDKIKEVLCKTK